MSGAVLLAGAALAVWALWDRSDRAVLASAMGLFASAAVEALAGAWPVAVLFTVLGVLTLGDWWRRRGGRDRARRWLGAKSRAVRDALSRRMREAAPEGA